MNLGGLRYPPDLRAPNGNRTRVDRLETCNSTTKLLARVYSSSWFRSRDLWVMSPAQFLFAKLLLLSISSSAAAATESIRNSHGEA